MTQYTTYDAHLSTWQSHQAALALGMIEPTEFDLYRGRQVTYNHYPMFIRRGWMTKGGFLRVDLIDPSEEGIFSVAVCDERLNLGVWGELLPVPAYVMYPHYAD